MARSRKRARRNSESNGGPRKAARTRLYTTPENATTAGVNSTTPPASTRMRDVDMTAATSTTQDSASIASSSEPASTERPVAGLGTLPLDLCHELLQVLPPSAARTLRSTCRNFLVEPQLEKYLVETVVISTHEQSVGKLGAIAADGSRRLLVKHIVFEDPWPATLEKLKKDHPDIRFNNLEEDMYGSYRSQIERYRGLASTMGSICHAVARFPNIRTVRFCSGFWDVPAHASGISIDVKDLLRVDLEGKTPSGIVAFIQEYPNRLWENRGCLRIHQTPPESEYAWLNDTVHKFQEMTRAVIMNPEHSGPISIEIDTVHDHGFEKVDHAIDFPMRSVQLVELRYRSRISQVEAFVRGDFLTMQGPAFEALEGLSIIGRSFENCDTIGIYDASSTITNFTFPYMPCLRKVSLINVDADDRFVAWLKSMPLQLHLHNFILTGDAMPLLAGPSNIRGATLTGLFGVYKSINDPNWANEDEVYIMDRQDNGKAFATSKRYWRFVSKRKWLKQRKVVAVMPKQATDFIVDGGPNPFTSQNRWARTDIFAWEE